MKVLSLFDGISCGIVALQRANIKVDEYIAYEIEKNAIKVSRHHFPEIKQMGDVRNADFSQYKGIDLLIGGSPCQGFSNSGKGLNFNDSRSRLFFEFVRALKEVKPKYFLLENVVMKKEWEDIISEYLGVKPILINSSLVSAQNRQRLYWTNIPNVEQPKDKGIKLIDILEDKSMVNKATIVGRRINNQGHREDYNKSIPITQCLEVRASNIDKSNCITTVDKDNVLTSLPIGRYPDAFSGELPFRYYTTTEYCRLQTLPDNYVDMIPKSAGRKALGNGWNVDTIAHIFSYLPNEYENKE